MQADSLAMVEHGLKHLLNCYIKDPTDYGNSEGDIYVYQVGDITKERRRWFRPEDVTVCVRPACHAQQRPVWIVCTNVIAGEALSCAPQELS